MKKLTIATHNNTLHADEVLAVALLLWNKNYTFKDVRLIRSRDSELLSLADITVDVGGVYDESKNLFDHHQFEKTNSLYGKSSAGLVAMSMDLSQFPTLVKLINDVDDQDTGIKIQEPFHFCNIISSYNTKTIHSKKQDKAFKSAVKFTIKLIKSLTARDLDESSQKDLVLQFKLLNFNDLAVAVSDKDIDWVHTKYFIGLADLVVRYDKNDKNWTVQTVALEEGSYKTKYSIEPRNTNNEIFVHKAGFIGKFIEFNEHISVKIKDVCVLNIPV